jgi:hypothetical protein
VTYTIVLPLVTIVSGLLVGVVVHPWAAAPRRLLGSPLMRVVGKRSYGLYLWSWPISRLLDAWQGSVIRFIIAMVITVVVSETCYRFVEIPIRRKGFRRWMSGWFGGYIQVKQIQWGISGGFVIALIALSWFYANVTPYNVAVDTASVALDLPVDPAVSTVPPSSNNADSATTVADTRRGVVLVGDSQANSFAVNLPDGTDRVFRIGDGSVEGCSVFDKGSAMSPTRGLVRSFEGCAGWQAKWVAAAQKTNASVAIVMVGAWDVFDRNVGGQAVPFASDAFNEQFLAGLQQGIDALAGAGVQVALLEVPCMRPVAVKGAGVQPFEERGDDARTVHLNRLFQKAVAANPGKAMYLPGPRQWCDNPAISTDLTYRWDGVHLYKPGVKLVLETIGPTILALPTR